MAGERVGATEPGPLQAGATERSPLGEAETASRLPRKVQEFLEGSTELESLEQARARGNQVRARQSQLLGERAAAEARDQAAATEAARAGKSAPADVGKLDVELQTLGAREGLLASAIEQARGLALAATRPLAAELAGELEQQAVAAVARATRDVEDARQSLQQASVFAAEARWCERLEVGDPGPFVSGEARSRAIPELDDALASIGRDEAERQERLHSAGVAHGQAEQEADAGAPGTA